MFCPKCGTQNPETGKYCRNCGTDLGNISKALSGKKKKNSFGMIEPTDSPDSKNRRKNESVNWETAVSKIFTGLAFLIVAAILGVTGVAGARVWWFWMLIPAFGALGSGFAQYIQLKKMEKRELNLAAPHQQPAFPTAPQNSALPPTQTEYVAPDSRYKTGDLVPPSVTEHTTRHLQMNSEGETISLPKQK